MFRAMKSSAFLVNVGRGSIIHENALIKALNKGWIAGAGLDVFETEPLPPNSPLWAMENVIISPHTSGMTQPTMIVSLISLLPTCAVICGANACSIS